MIKSTQINLNTVFSTVMMGICISMLNTQNMCNYKVEGIFKCYFSALLLILFFFVVASYKHFLQEREQRKQQKQIH